MNFAETTIASVKSVSQRSLALAWQRAARGSRYPQLADFHPSSRACDPRYIVIWKVEDGADGPDFRALYQGDFIAAAFRDQWVGKSMAAVVPEKLRAPALAAANFSTRTGRAIYMNYATRDQNGGSINCERLLLPFGTAANGVRQLIASNEPISFDGDVVLTKAVEDFVGDFEITTAGHFSC